MENGRMDKGKWGGVFLVVLIAAAMLLAGLAIYYHNKVGGYTEENAAYREAADRMMATAFLDIRREMSGDRETALEMSRNFDQAEFSHFCSQLHSGYADEIRMINQIDEMASQKLSGYDAGSLLFYFSDLNDLGQRGLLTQEDADALTLLSRITVSPPALTMSAVLTRYIHRESSPMRRNRNQRCCRRQRPWKTRQKTNADR